MSFVIKIFLCYRSFNINKTDQFNFMNFSDRELVIELIWNYQIQSNK